MKTVEQIAAELQGYDPTALSVPAVHAFLEQLATPLAETEEVALFEALGRVLAEDLVSPFSVPPRDNSAMDGYAFAHGTLPADGAALTVVGTALAGKAWAGVVQPGQCLRITTGAIMPEGTDTVVPQELAQVDGDQVTVRPALLRRHKALLNFVHVHSPHHQHRLQRPGSLALAPAAACAWLTALPTRRPWPDAGGPPRPRPSSFFRMNRARRAQRPPELEAPP